MTDAGTISESVTPTREIPGPKYMGFKELRAMRAHAPRFFSDLRQKYGPVVRFPYGNTVGYLIADPRIVQDVYIASDRKFEKDVIKTGPGPDDRHAPLETVLGQGLATSRGDFHRKQRRVIQPMFNRVRINAYGDIFVEHAAAAGDRWRDGQALNVHDEMYELALGMIAKTVFDVSLDAEISHTIRTAFPRKGGPLMWEQVVPFGRYMMRVPTPVNRRFWKGLKKLDQIVLKMIEDRRRTGLHGDDLLSVLLGAQDAETGERMDNDVIRDEAVTLLMAGHETSSGGLTWAYHLLARNPGARERMFAEIDEVLGGRLPTAEDLPALKWTDAVFSEALRIFPPVWTTVRRTLVEYSHDGYVIPPDSLVMISPWVVHHDPEWWPQPEVFAPQRWIADNDSSDPLAGQAVAPGRPRLAYLPFGAGPRQCIGNSFARMEAVLVLATLGRHWDFEEVDKVTDPKLLTHITTQPAKGMHMIAHRR